jgi:hypothetical protein
LFVAHDCLRVKSGPDAVIRVYDAAGNVIETHEQAGDLIFASTHLQQKVS